MFSFVIKKRSSKGGAGSPRLRVSGADFLILRSGRPRFSSNRSKTNRASKTLRLLLQVLYQKRSKFAICTFKQSKLILNVFLSNKKIQKGVRGLPASASAEPIFLFYGAEGLDFPRIGARRIGCRNLLGCYYKFYIKNDPNLRFVPSKIKIVFF